MKSRFIALITVCMLIPAILLAQPAGKKQLVGVWEVKEAPVEQSQSPLLSLAMFRGDGSFIKCVGYKALPAVANEIGPSFGQLVRTGDREFRVTTYALMWKAGQVNGFQRFQSYQVLSESGDEFISHTTMDILDRKWNVVFSTTSEAKGTRLETPARIDAQVNY